MSEQEERDAAPYIHVRMSLARIRSLVRGWVDAKADERIPADVALDRLNEALHAEEITRFVRGGDSVGDIPTTPAIPPERHTSIPAGWWERIEADEERLNEEIRAEAQRLRAEMDPAEIDRLVKLAMPIVRRLMEKYRC